jgi:cytosine/adenosine deaminase-related metal-dependent hydrolase
MHAATVVVHSCTGSDVDMVVVDGTVVIENRKLISVNEEEVKQTAREAAAKIRQRSGIDAQPSKMGWTYV